MNLEQIASIVVDEAYHIHAELGPGLLESVYQKVLSTALRQRGLQVETEVPVSFSYHGMKFDADLRIDLLVDNALVVELKSAETTLPVHKKQLLTYLRLTGRPLGLLINFGLATFKEGCSRVVNHYDESLARSREAEKTVHQNPFGDFAPSREETVTRSREAAKTHDSEDQP